MINAGSPGTVRICRPLDRSSDRITPMSNGFPIATTNARPSARSGTRLCVRATCAGTRGTTVESTRRSPPSRKGMSASLASVRTRSRSLMYPSATSDSPIRSPVVVRLASASSSCATLISPASTSDSPSRILRDIRGGRVGGRDRNATIGAPADLFRGGAQNGTRRRAQLLGTVQCILARQSCATRYGCHSAAARCGGRRAQPDDLPYRPRPVYLGCGLDPLIGAIAVAIANRSRCV